MLEPFDYDRWLSTPPKLYTEPEEDEDEAYDSWVDRQLCEMD
jgi:hypothetical protein